MRMSKILVVDDEEMVADIVVHMISRTFPGITITVCKGDAAGVKAMTILNDKSDFRLVVTDWNMPYNHHRGCEGGRAVLEAAKTANIPVIVMTGMASSFEKASRADVVLMKPFSLTAFINAVKPFLSS